MILIINSVLSILSIIQRLIDTPNSAEAVITQCVRSSHHCLPHWLLLLMGSMPD
jgi:hypothetical protein